MKPLAASQHTRTVMMEQTQLPVDRKLRLLHWTIVAGVVAVGIVFAALAVASPCGLVLFCFYLWVVLFLYRKADKFAALALVACGLCLLNCLRVSVTDPSELFRRSACLNNLKQIALAMHNYANKYGTFPPAYVADSQGKPIHSWRALLLPFLDDEQLSKKYSFDEPWDGPNNRQLHNIVIRTYTCWSDAGPRTDPTMTSYVVVTGPNTAFPGARSVKFSDFRKPLSNVLLVIEVANSGIHWMEPRDLPYSEMDFKINGKPGKSLSSCHGWSWEYSYPAVVCVVYADGHAEYLPITLSPDALKEQITISKAKNTE
jgi:hypothetical protein